jgi:hypothetical protein
MDGTTAVSEGIADALEEVALGDDGETLLDIAGLGHGSTTRSSTAPVCNFFFLGFS